MTDPQLIILKDGFFRPGELVSHNASHFLGFDLERNLLLAEEKIEPRSLQNLGSFYLGDKHFTDETSFSSYVTHEEFYYRALIIGGILNSLVGQGRDIAREFGAQYFNLYLVRSNLRERTSLNPTSVMARYHRSFEEEINPKIEFTGFHRKVEQPKEIEFTLHPTVNLYVPK
ncbi:MAG TPA: hypothetical protein VJH20_06170 [Candidatus Nanoarchaeia archaeon]|nr:hypothetical protein [Candidatus Nanoarchaeia archaeon]